MSPTDHDDIWAASRCFHSLGKWASPLKPENVATGRICQGVTAEFCCPANTGVRVMTHSCSDGHQGDASSHQAPALQRVGKPGDILGEVPLHGRLPVMGQRGHISPSLRQLGGSSGTSPQGNRSSCNDGQPHLPPPNKVWYTTPGKTL